MLDSIRKRKDNFIFSFLIVITAIVMGFFGISKFSDQDRGGGMAASVNGEPISRRDFQIELEGKLQQYQSLLGGQYDEKFLAALQVPQRTLEEMIQFKLLAQQATRLKILVPDEELADHIRSLPYYQRDGKFDAETYKKIPNPGQEERRRRERLQLAKFQTYLVDRVRLTPAASRRAFELRETKVDLEYAKIDFNQLASQQPQPAKEVDAFLKSAPEKELSDYYEAHKRDFTERAKVKMSQIRVGVPFQAKDVQKAEAKKKIEAVAKDITEKNFAELAKKNSDDEYAKKGGNVGWVSRGSLEPALEAALDKLEPNTVSKPVETPFGYYLLLVSEKKAEVVKPLADVKREIAEKLVAEKSRKEFIDKKVKDWDAVLAGGKSLEPELKKYKVEVKKTGPFSIAQGSIPSIGPADTVIDGVFNLTMDSPAAKKLYQFGDSYYWIKLKSVEKAKDADYEKNRESVDRSVETALQTELITKWVAGLQKTANIKTELKF